MRIALGACLTALLLTAGCQQMESPPGIRFVGDLASDPTRQHDHDFEPTGNWSQLSENLYLFRDTCNVYIIKQGSDALLVDFGSGAALGILGEIGAERVSQILITHHHRDQVQGLVEVAKEPSFQVVAPEKESAYLDRAGQFWANAPLYLNYDLRSHFNTVRRSIRVDRKVNDGDRFNWGAIQFNVLETPAHTEHSVSYGAVIDGHRVVFTGDLIAGEGKVIDWFDLHWDYYGFTQGIDASEASFDTVLKTDPDWLLPSHGNPIRDPDTAIGANRRVHETLRDLLPPNELHRTIGPIAQHYATPGPPRDDRGAVEG